MFSPVVSAISFTQRSRIARFARPRKSIFSNPTSATGCMEYCVVGLELSLPLVDRCRGTCSVSGFSEMTTAAACVLACRTEPSTFCAIFIKSRVLLSRLISFFNSADSAIASFSLIFRVGGIIFASLSLKLRGNANARAVSRMAALATSVPKVTI